MDSLLELMEGPIFALYGIDRYHRDASDDEDERDRARYAVIVVLEAQLHG